MHCPKSGFTLVELMVVVAIVAILSAISMTVYTKYHDNALENEASANLFALSHEAGRIISDWGIHNGKDFGGSGSINPGCLPANPASTSFGAGDTAAWNSLAQWNDLDIQLEGTQHWQYQLCFFVKGSNNSEEYQVVSKRYGAAKFGLIDSSRARPAFFDKKLPALSYSIGSF